MKFLACGHAVLVECDSPEARRALYPAVRHAFSGVAANVVPASRTILVDSPLPPEQVRHLVEQVAAGRSAGRAGARHIVPTVYDGPDLAAVAELRGGSVEALIAWHTGQDWYVDFCGFMPGFAYLTGERPMDVPRLASPRTRIPAGSVGLAGEFSGIYPTDSPGGWQLLGRTHLVLWDPENESPALLRPGDIVRFEVAR